MFNNFLSTVKDAANTVAQSVEEQQRNQNSGNNETMERIDSKNGKVQVSSVQDTAETPELSKKGSDFLSGLVNVAQVVGKSLEENNRQKQENEEHVAKIDSKGGKVQVTTVQTEQKTAEKGNSEFLSGLVNVAQDIGKVVGKSLEDQKANKSEETVARIDSKGGKVQVSSIQDEKTHEKDKSDFLSGLVGVAQDLGKAYEQSKHSNEKKEEQNPSKFTDSDLKALGENIGSIVGGIWKKEEQKKEEFAKEKPVIDDIEGEIGRVTTSGYTTSLQK